MCDDPHDEVFHWFSPRNRNKLHKPFRCKACKKIMWWGMEDVLFPGTCNDCAVDYRVVNGLSECCGKPLTHTVTSLHAACSGCGTKETEL